MRAVRSAAAAGIVLAAGLAAMSADLPGDPSRPQIRPGHVKPIAPDPNRIAVSSPREFTVSSPDMGTEAVFPILAACGAYHGYALVYEALTDRVGQGHVQTIFVMRDRDMNELTGSVYKGPVPLTERADSSQLRFVRLMRFPGPDEKFLCVYELDLSGRRQGYFRLIDPFTMGRFGEARPLGRPDEDVRVSAVRFLPGLASAVIVYSAAGKSRYLVVDREGRPVYTGRPGHTSEQETSFEASDIAFLPDGQWMIAAKHGAPPSRPGWGMRAMDPFGVWTGGAKGVPDMPNTPLSLLEALKPNSFLVSNGEERAAIVDQDGRLKKLIPAPPCPGRPSSHVERLDGDRLMFFYIHQNDQRSSDIQAQVTDFSGNVLKSPQTVLRNGLAAAGFARKWGSKSELVVFIPVLESGRAKFRSVTISE